MTVPPVAISGVESYEPNNAPQQKFIEDDVNEQNNRLKIVERVGTAELARQMEIVYAFVGLPYPPP
jgi:hypothetical protein